MASLFLLIEELCDYLITRFNCLYGQLDYMSLAIMSIYI